MRVWLDWLCELVDIPVPDAELAERLTLTGTEVELVEMPCGELSGVVTARVLNLTDHPAKTSWKIASIDTGGEPISVVTAAPNVQIGGIYPYAPAGAVLACGTEMGVRDFGGVPSSGMMLSAAEIGLPDLDDSGGLLLLPDDFPVGCDFLEHTGLDAPVFELSVTPNRGDVCSMMGVAREVHALFADAHMAFPIVEEAAGDVDWSRDFDGVHLHNDGCTEYVLGYAEGVKIAPAPFDARLKLVVSGMRPVSNVVDATNIAMLLFGQPLHAFDRDSLINNRIDVSYAKPGPFVTLDGKERALTDSDLMICSGDTPLGLAGVMGGLDSEITDSSVRIVLESAVFEPAHIARTARRLGLPSGASFRFARGIDSARMLPAAWYTLRLFEEWGGAKLGDTVVRASAKKDDDARTVTLRPASMDRLLGFSDMYEASEILARLGFAQCGCSADGWVYRVPSWRHDVSIEEDLIEEIGRVRGYDCIAPKFSTPVHSHGTTPPSYGAIMSLRDVMLSRAYMEVMTYSFLHPRELSRMGIDTSCVGIVNPISQDQIAMRPAIMPGLLRAAESNLRAGWRAGMRMFETGRVFASQGSAVTERDHIAGLVYGGKDRHVLYKDRTDDDFFTVKSDIEAIINSRGLTAQWCSGTLPFGHRGQTAIISIDGEDAGYLARMSPALERELDMTEGTYLFELDIHALSALRPGSYGNPWRYPPTARDIALIASEDISAYKVKQDIQQLGNSDILAGVELFDTYSGGGVADGHRSLAFEILYRHADRTLQDEEVEVSHNLLRKKLAEAGYRLR